MQTAYWPACRPNHDRCKGYRFSLSSQIAKNATSVIVHERRPGIAHSWLVTRASVDRNHLSRMFHHEIALTIKEHIERTLLAHAHDMLGMGDMSTAEVTAKHET